MINTIRRLLLVLVACCLHASMALGAYTEFTNLYPDCEDNQASQIYEPEAWPDQLQLPVFPDGGDVEFLRYLDDRVEDHYPDVVDSTVPSQTPGEPDKVYRAKGTVFVHITIDRCGKAVNPVVKKGMNEKYDSHAVKICDGLPIFKPGVLDGYRVKVGLVVPVRFRRSTLPVTYDFGDGDFSDDDGGGGDDGGDSGDDGSYDDSGWGDPW